MKLQLVQAMTCLALVAGARAQNAPFIRGAAVPLDVESAETEGDECGRHCTSNADCRTGGYVTCGECHSIPGGGVCEKVSWGTPAPTPFDYFPDEYPMCAKSCREDRDCEGQGGVYNPCYQCGQYQGTLMYHKCFREEPVVTPVTPAPTPVDYFPDGYPMCKKSCRHDKDCEGQGGVYNPCYTCGQYQGSVMFHRCYQPAGTEEE